jgi:hypothetical protein
VAFVQEALLPDQQMQDGLSHMLQEVLQHMKVVLLMEVAL